MIMAKSKNTGMVLLIVTLILLVAGGVSVWCLIRKKRQSNSSDSGTTSLLTDDGNSNANQGIYTTTSSNDSFPLSYDAGHKSALVMDLQEKLNVRICGLLAPVCPYDEAGNQIKELKVDGYFGKKTLAVVKFVFNGATSVTETMYKQL